MDVYLTAVLKTSFTHTYLLTDRNNLCVTVNVDVA